MEAVIAASDSELNNVSLNVGSGGSYTINELVSKLGGEKIYIPKRPGEPDQTYADITKIKKLLSWSPKVSFSDGVNKMLSYIEEWKNAPVWTPEMIADATKDWHKYLGN